MDTLFFDFGFDSMQMFDDMNEFNMSAMNPLYEPLIPMPLDGMDMFDMCTFPVQDMMMPTPYHLPNPVQDSFDPIGGSSLFSIDIISGLPITDFPNTSAQVIHEQTIAKLEDHSILEHERDIAVQRQNEAIESMDYENALEWENIANSKQQQLYDLWGTPQYGLPAKAPGIK